MQHNKLRHLIRLLLSEAKRNPGADTLGRWAQGGNSIEQGLAAHGIIPIPRGGTRNDGKGDSYIKAGAYNEVYEVLWNGKRAVARFGWNSVFQEEYTNFAEFISSKERLPTKFHKHFPIVYDTFEFMVSGEERNQIPVKGFVIEFLNPLPSSLAAMIHDIGGGETLSHERKLTTLLPAVINATIKKITKNKFIANELQYFYDEKLVPLLAQRLESETFATKMFQLVDKIPEELGSFHEQFVSDIIELLLHSPIPVFPQSDYERPQKGSPKDLVNSKLPTSVREFKRFLEALEGYNIHYGDLHSENYLQRGNGTIVVSDPGAFVINSHSSI